jgi:Peptidase A4 family
MSSALLAGAIALSIPGSFMPGTQPPEPPVLEQPSKVREAWAKLPYMNQIKPILKRNEGVFHGPHQPIVSNSVSTTTSSNWSGAAIAANPSQYATTATSFIVVVPNASYAFNAPCPSNPGAQAYTGIWSGIDGFGNSTVKQAGLSIISNCLDQSSVAPFIETYPNPEVIVTNFPIARGDVLVVWLWVDQASKVTCATWEDESQNAETSACLTAPAAFPASTVEWVVERPSLESGALTTLGNYVAAPIWAANAWDYNSGAMLATAAADPSYWGAPGSFYFINMLDNNGNPISAPNPRVLDTLLMFDTGSAYCASGCVTQFADVAE